MGSTQCPYLEWLKLSHLSLVSKLQCFSALALSAVHHFTFQTQSTDESKIYPSLTAQAKHLGFCY